jgi:hypothetical protein
VRLRSRSSESVCGAGDEHASDEIPSVHRLDSLADLPFDGLLMHVTGQTEQGFCVVDVFESEEAVERFNEAMGTMPREVGIEEPPEFVTAHTFVWRPSD